MADRQVSAGVLVVKRKLPHVFKADKTHVMGSENMWLKTCPVISFFSPSDFFFFNESLKALMGAMVRCSHRGPSSSHSSGFHE